MKLNINTAYLLLLGFSMLSACGSSIPRKDLQNLPTLVEIMALDFNTNTVKLRVSHRNRTTREQNQLSCQLAINNQAAVQLTNVSIPDLTTYAVETVEIPIDLSQTLITNEQPKELPYVLDCFLTSINFRKEQIVSKATVYQIPGETHIFR
jgi:hypothetical protein